MHGSSNCLQLLDGCDINTEEGRKTMKDLDLRNVTCKACVQTAVEILEEMKVSIQAAARGKFGPLPPIEPKR